MPIRERGRSRGAENAGGSRALILHPYCFELQCWHTFSVARVEMHRNRYISIISRFTMRIGVRGRDRGLRLQAGAGHPLSTHVALNCNVGTRLGWKKSKSIEIGIYQASPGSLC